jgi:hypothetical protein
VVLGILHTGRAQRSILWWLDTSESGTLQLYQPKQGPLICIVTSYPSPSISILGLLLIVSAGDYGTILTVMRNCKDEHIKQGKSLYHED